MLIRLWQFIFDLHNHQIGVLLYLGMILSNTLINTLALRLLGHASPPAKWPPVAVLIPARNEESNIRRCVTSLLAQDYPDFSVWVLDDHSEDRTPEILAELAAGDTRLHVLHGAPLPVGWLGKTWACQQLAQAVPADVPLLLFVDADTWHAPAMLRAAVAEFLSQPTDLLSVLPRQFTLTLAEKLTVPIIPWSLFTHFPLALAQRLRWPFFAAAIGQAMLWRRSAYQTIGGHEAARMEVAEDIALARLTARAGLRWRLIPGPEHVFCRMYRSVPAVWEGFGKNLYAIFGRNPLVFVFIWLWQGVVFFGPWIMLAGARLLGWPVSLSLVSAEIVFAVVLWALTTRQLRLSALVVPLYPAVVLTSILLAFNSLGQTIAGKATWKNRPVTLRW